MPERTPDGVTVDEAGVTEASLILESPTTGHADATAAPTVAGAMAAPAAGAFRKRRLGIVFWISVGWISLVVLLAVLAPLLPLEQYRRTGAGLPRQGFLAECRPGTSTTCGWLGTDTLGRDILSRVVWGSRVSLAVGFMSIFFGFVIGGFLGIVAGYFRRRLESLITGFMDVLLAFPSLVLLLAAVTFLAEGKPTIWHVTLAIGVLSIAPLGRIIRASTLTFAQREFVLAARTLGAKNGRIIRREILPNVLLPAMAFSLTAVAVAIVAEGALAFLGLSVQPPTPTWGGMINEGRIVLRDSAHVSLTPGFVLFFTVLAMNFVGDSLAARFSVREGAL